MLQRNIDIGIYSLINVISQNMFSHMIYVEYLIVLVLTLFMWFQKQLTLYKWTKKY